MSTYRACILGLQIQFHFTFICSGRNIAALCDVGKTTNLDNFLAFLSVCQNMNVGTVPRFLFEKIDKFPKTENHSVCSYLGDKKEIGD